MAKVTLIKSIEATKLHPKTGTPLGLPDVTIAFGAVVEWVGTDRDRQKFTYLGESYSCGYDAWFSGTGTKPPEKNTPASSTGQFSASKLMKAASSLQWEQVQSSEYTVQRAKVPGGWLVVIEGRGVAFYPDPNGQW